MHAPFDEYWVWTPAIKELSLCLLLVIGILVFAWSCLFMQIVIVGWTGGEAGSTFLWYHNLWSTGRSWCCHSCGVSCSKQIQSMTSFILLMEFILSIPFSVTSYWVLEVTVFHCLPHIWSAELSLLWAQSCVKFLSSEAVIGIWQAIHT